MVDLQELELFSSGTLNAPVANSIWACNPTVDLFATASDTNVVNIWRARGQLVAKHVERNHKIEALQWKPDGQYLATGWNDGVLRLLGFENGKASHQIPIFEKGQSKFAYIAWSRNRIVRRRKKTTARSDGSWRNLLYDDSDESDSTHEGSVKALSLPEELTFIEVDTALPKLSPLPVSGGSGADMLVFTTRNSLDFIFRPFKADDTRNVDVTLVGTVDGQVLISIYDSFIIGKFHHPIPKSFGSGEKMQLCCYASHQDISTHALLFKPSSTEPGSVENAVHLVPVDLTFIYSSPINLSLLASKTTMLQNLLRYIKQAQIHMAGEWRSTRELPARFMASVQDDLLKLDKGRDIVQSLYHTVVTGHVYAPMKEWLLDSLAERGHKRWDKAVTSGLENLRALIHENMMPALQRVAIILSRLRGIARFEASNNDIGFTAAQVSKLIDITQCLYAVCYKILRLVMKELVLFSKFSIWLRLEIDRLASSTMSDELLERQANVDFPKVLKYIKGHLITSPMSIFFDDVGDDDRASGRNKANDTGSIRELLETQVKRQQAGQSYLKALPQLEFIVDYMTSRSDSMLKSIAEMQRRRVRFAPATRLAIDGQISRYDVRICAKQKQSGLHGQVFTALGTAERPNEVQIFQTDLEIINGISSPAATRVNFMVLPEGNVIDFKFLDDRSLLVLWIDSGSNPVPTLISIPFQSLPYSPYASGQVPEATTFQSKDFGSQLTAARLPRSSTFEPLQMEVVRNHSLRGEIPARVCLLGRDKATYMVYAIPKDWEFRQDATLEED